MDFYPEIKDGMSPSAIAQWFNSRAAFVKSYFLGERGPQTKSMETGTAIHALIEGGMMAAKHVYAASEEDISVTVAEGKVFRGRPDSHDTEAKDGVARFVDYKTGKANGWKEKLPTDMKMKATAYLVWKLCGEPEKVEGYIEFFQTEWDPQTRAIVQIEGKESEEEHITYHAKDLADFGTVIASAMDDVNAAYLKWLKRGDFVSQEDVEAYVTKKNEITKAEAELDEIGERIKAQMEFGGEENHKVEGIGSFYFKTTETYEYPDDLPVRVLDQELTLAQAGEVDAASRAAKKNFTLISEPVSVKTTINYKAATAKK